MAKGMPSMVALLGLLAVAGYQNRDKLKDLLGGAGATGGAGRDPNAPAGGLGDMLGGLGDRLSTGSAGGLGGVLSGGLGDLLDRFRDTGRGQKADSWLGNGPNEEVDAADIEEALGPETIDTLTRQTGLSREELLERLAKTLPEAVNRFTPDGRVPSQSEAARFFDQPGSGFQA